MSIDIDALEALLDRAKRSNNAAEWDDMCDLESEAIAALPARDCLNEIRRALDLKQEF